MALSGTGSVNKQVECERVPKRLRMTEAQMPNPRFHGVHIHALRESCNSTVFPRKSQRRNSYTDGRIESNEANEYSPRQADSTSDFPALFSSETWLYVSDTLRAHDCMNYTRQDMHCPRLFTVSLSPPNITLEYGNPAPRRGQA